MIMVTGASGQLGSQILKQLSDRGVDAFGGSRTPAAGMRYLDLDLTESIDFSGVRTLVLVSAGYAEDDQVVDRHEAAVRAAVRDGVEHVVYTSVTTGGDHLGFALAHRATERMIQTSGMGWTILRNGLYAELFGALMSWRGEGLESPFGAGALAAVARDDLAEAAAIVASAPERHGAKIYDLVGPLIDAVAVAEHLGVRHRSIDLAEYRRRLLGDTALLPFQPSLLASIATAVRHGFLNGASSDLRNLLGRPLTDAVVIAGRAAAVSVPTR
ncbi:NAD(P)H-binding protein [Zhihengliuella sp.]|uniref:NAD(P)H-binding protein n=1 Tax=Zhihengliuella sp. TaxID=1954483 RepID=UPI002811D295|nr:NAD(P)H-binding protein [Zhihengliuella sp.]